MSWTHHRHHHHHQEQRLERKADRAHRDEMFHKQTESELHARATDELLHGHIGQFVNLEAKARQQHNKAERAHNREVSAQISADAHHHMHGGGHHWTHLHHGHHHGNHGSHHHYNHHVAPPHCPSAAPYYYSPGACYPPQYAYPPAGSIGYPPAGDAVSYPAYPPATYNQYPPAGGYPQ